MFALCVRFTCNDAGDARAFDALVTETVALIRGHEPGTLIYAVNQVEGKPLERIFYELYRDRAAFDAHEGQPHTRGFLAARGAFLESVEVDFLTLQTGKGTDGSSAVRGLAEPGACPADAGFAGKPLSRRRFAGRPRLSKRVSRVMRETWTESRLRGGTD